MSSATGSRVSHAGDPIEGTIIAPVMADGRIAIPLGSTVSGHIASAHAIGWGLKRSTASISYDFGTLRLTSGASVAINTQLVEVETAKEHVDSRGIVHGIHPIASISSTLAFYTVPLLFLAPEAGIPIWGIKTLAAPSANPEINFPAGTELILRLTEPAEIPADMDSMPIAAFSPGRTRELERILDESPRRAYLGKRPSDLVNLLFVGTRMQIFRALQAAGWTPAERRSPISLYRLFHALSKRHGYPRAPMDALTLGGRRSGADYQKGLDTVEKRHHARLWQDPDRADVWLGTAAEDIGLRFNSTHWTHATDPNVDNERAKIVNDLAFTGCLERAGLLREPAPLEDTRAVWAAIADQQVAAVELNDCAHPRAMAGVESNASGREHGALVSGALAVLREDVLRSNILFTSYNTVRFIAKHGTKPTRITPQARGLEWLNSLEMPHIPPGAVAGR